MSASAHVEDSEAPVGLEHAKSTVSDGSHGWRDVEVLYVKCVIKRELFIVCNMYVN